MKDSKENNMDKRVDITIVGFVTNHKDVTKRKVLTVVPTLKNKGIWKTEDKEKNATHFVRPVYVYGKYNANHVEVANGEVCYKHNVVIAGHDISMPADGFFAEAIGEVYDQDGETLDKTTKVKQYRYNKFFMLEMAEQLIPSIGATYEESKYNLLTKKQRERKAKTLKEQENNSLAIEMAKSLLNKKDS